MFADAEKTLKNPPAFAGGFFIERFLNLCSADIVPLNVGVG